jgi:hypothetical protein
MVLSRCPYLPRPRAAWRNVSISAGVKYSRGRTSLLRLRRGGATGSPTTRNTGATATGCVLDFATVPFTVFGMIPTSPRKPDHHPGFQDVHQLLSDFWKR